jgi:hypothetical protein
MMSGHMRPPVRWFALLALLAAIGACVAAPPSPDPCACGPARAQAPTADPALAPGVGVAEHGSADEPTSPPKQVGPPSAEPAPAADGLPDLDDPVWTRVPSRAGRYVVYWRSLTGSVPRNQDFDMAVWVVRDGAPAVAAHLGVNAWMPDHGHGMLREPRAEARGDGSFLVEGMLLHMRGHWTLLFDVLEGTFAETAEHGLDL